MNNIFIILYFIYRILTLSDFLMEKQIIRLILWVTIWISLGYLVAKIFFFLKIKNHRKDAVDRSRSVVLWYVNEKISPLLSDFPYNYKDLVFLWKWIDYVVFDWLYEWNLKKIVFLEIKSGQSTLNKNEKMIKNCVDSKNIFYRVWHKN